MLIFIFFYFFRLGEVCSHVDGKAVKITCFEGDLRVLFKKVDLALQPIEIMSEWVADLPIRFSGNFKNGKMFNIAKN